MQTCNHTVVAEECDKRAHLRGRLVLADETLYARVESVILKTRLPQNAKATGASIRFEGVKAASAGFSTRFKFPAPASLGKERLVFGAGTFDTEIEAAFAAAFTKPCILVLLAACRGTAMDAHRLNVLQVASHRAGMHVGALVRANMDAARAHAAASGSGGESTALRIRLHTDAHGEHIATTTNTNSTFV